MNLSSQVGDSWSQAQAPTSPPTIPALNKVVASSAVVALLAAAPVTKGFNPAEGSPATEKIAAGTVSAF